MKNINYFSSKASEFVKKFDNHEFLVVSILFIIGFFLRLYLINENLFFGYEQGRDLLVVKDIIQNHDLVLIGPKTDIDGVFHGPFFYYLLGIPFILSHGSPIFISIFLIFINSLSIYFIYLLGKEIFNKKIGFFSALLLTFSFGSIVMARWLSNPPLIVPISCLLFYFLAKFLRGRKNYLILVGIFYGLAGQVNFLNYLIFGVILFIIFILFFKEFKKTPIYLLILSLVMVPFFSIFNYILFDLKHDFLISNNLINVILQGKGYFLGHFDALRIAIVNISNIYTDLIFPFYKFFAFIILTLSVALLVLYKDKKDLAFKFLSVWIFSPILVFFILKHASLYHYFAVIIAPLIICTAMLLYKIYSIKKWAGLTFIIIFITTSLIYSFNNLPRNKNVFFQSTQPELRYSDQIKVIEKIYTEANGKEFSVQAYTIPYWSPQGWEYLFWNYGTKNNKYIPVDNSQNQLFVIIQKDQNNLLYQGNWLKNTVSYWGREKSEFSQGDLRVKMIIVNED